MGLQTTLRLVAVLVLFTVTIASASSDDIMLADFEGSDYGRWQVTGEAFGTGPAHGALGDQAEVRGFEGKGFVNTYHGGDRAEGIMTSPEFVIERDFLNFLIGGGDTGRTFTEYPGNPLIEHEGRDPKVFWYGPQNKWVMVVYDINDGQRGFAFYDSKNLRQWRRMSWIGGFFECPDMFELPIQGSENIKKWVLHGADGRYLLGAFDGTTFIPDSPQKIPMDYGANFYAVYTYSNIPPKDGRTIQLAWMRDGKYPGMPFNQQLTFPCEVTLRNTPQGLRLCRNSVREIKLLRKKQHKWQNLTLKPRDKPLEGIAGELFEIQAEIEPAEAREIGFRIRGVDVVYNVKKQKIYCLGEDGPLKPIDGRIDLHLLVDRTSLEVFGNNGLLSMSSCMLPQDDNKSLVVFCGGGRAKLLNLKVWELDSIWTR